jgi:hypothetical protein
MIWRKINYWSNKHLSQAGREVMFKSILQTIPTYVMSIFLLPSTLIDDIEKMLNSFWWGHRNENVRGLHWLSWERLSVSKDYGGMGFKNLQAFNLAMLGKQAWNLITKPESLITKLLKAKYFPKCDFFDSSIGHNPSFVWRSIWNAKFVIQGGYKWSIGNGDTIKVWEQNWLKEGMSLPLSTDTYNLQNHVTVKDLLMPNSKKWNYEVLCSMFEANTVSTIMKTPLFDSVREDTIVWKLEQDGNYSVRSAYKLCVNIAGLHNRHGCAGSWNLIWRAKIPPKVKNLLWRICRNILPTRLKLNSRGVQCPTSCAVCNTEDEDIMHVFFMCQKSVQCWQRTGLWDRLNTCLDVNKSVADNLFSILQRLDNEQQELFSVILWSLWKGRNNQIWDNVTNTS